MPYTKNPYLPKARQEAVNLVYQGWSTRKVARHFGLGSGTVSKWMKRDCYYGLRPIPTESSRPFFHPHALSAKMVNAIVKTRLKHNRCSEVVHRELANQGLSVSLSSVKRTLKRQGLIRKRSPWKRWHLTLPRPEALKPGDLIQVDTIHLGPCDADRIYVYTLLDVFSRWAYALPSLKINTHLSLRFVKEAQDRVRFPFLVLQTDHGQEFSSWFTEHTKQLDVLHRHSRVRQANDNGHVERFNRTLQEECLSRIPRTLRAYRREIPEYLHYYNAKRLHLGINLKTPLQCVQAIG